jgi:molecular chaperone GrpE
VQQNERAQNGDQDSGQEPAGSADHGQDAAKDDHAGAEQDQDQQSLEQRLFEAESSRDDYLELARRAQADLDNYKKRSGREAAQAKVRAKAEVIAELLPVADNLERALGAEDSGQALKQGVELVYRELLAALERCGAERFGCSGEAFDPNLHEALSTRGAEGVAAGQILEVFQTGAKLDGAVIRPARVVVSA